MHRLCKCGLGMTSIFIQIPSYRDWELPETIKNAVEQSSGLINLNFGVHECVLPQDDIGVPTDLPKHAKVHYKKSIAPDNIGLQMSRRIANDFYDGEDYYLQIDAHMRFVKDWDTKALQMIGYYKAHGIKKPMLTMYPAVYSYGEDGNLIAEPVEDLLPRRVSFHENHQQFKDILIPVQTAVWADFDCGYTASVSGGFIFTDGSFSKIKPNPKIAFWGEEPLIASRAYTHGFTPVLPSGDLVWHLYHCGYPFKRVRRILVWEDFSELWADLDAKSRAEYYKIMKERVIGEEGFGSERSLEEYEAFSGLNFQTGVITQELVHR